MRRYAAILLLCCANASAEIYRCERNGRVEFSDRACVGGQVPIDIAPPNSMETSRGEALLAAQYDREGTALLKARRASLAADEKTNAQRRRQQDRMRDAALHGDVAVGMTSAQVTALLGNPSSVRSSESETGKSETWTFRDGNIAHSVQFKDGKVSSVSKRTAKHRR
jgi:hypothetical protein